MRLYPKEYCLRQWIDFLRYPRLFNDFPLLYLLTACFDFENKYSIDRDGNGLSTYDGYCNEINIALAEFTDDDGDGEIITNTKS